MLKDARGNAVTLTNPKALDAYERALRAFNTYRGDPIAPLDEAIALDAGFAAAYATKALILCTLFERRFMNDALAVLDQGRAALQFATAREQALAGAARRIAEGDWHGGTRALEEVLVDHPRDLVALQVAHLMDFYRGDALNLRNRITRVLPAWDEKVPGHAYVLGMHAFGYEECNQYPEAERAGRRAVELSGDDSWAVHAVAHVMEMQGRIADGLAWYEQTYPVWAGEDNGFAFHNHWHSALYRMDRGEHEAALAVFDRYFTGPLDMVLPRIDATALLWRLMLEGVDVGARFGAVADAWEATLGFEGGFYAFNDFHAAMAFAAAGRRESLGRLRAATGRAVIESRANAAMTRAVGVQACEAAIDWCEGRFDAAARHLVAVRDAANAFGGSHAQRDLLTLTLIDAAARAGRTRLARHYANERLVHKPDAAWGRRLAERIEARGAKRAA
ncbi:MAG: tetratricopeptide repeat protein [Burkholderiales bacterium]